MIFGIEYEFLALLFFVGGFSAFINVMSGGGSALVLPILIMMGMDANTANGTNRIAIFSLTLSAIISMRKQEVSDFRFSLKMSLFTLPGVILGAYFAQDVSNEAFKEILAWVIFMIIGFMIMPDNLKKYFINRLSVYPKMIYPIMLFVGFYGGFVQVGVGFILMLALQSFLNLNLINVNMHKVFIVFIYTIPALIMFIIFGNVEIVPGLVLAAGNAIGGWWSASMSIKKGDKLIKIFLVISLIVMSLKMLEII
jgi:uncharacterized membrane protein YfcA